jgi:hypothetical protein
MTLDGSCHCGGVRIAFHTAKAPGALGARACQCSFCRAHGASWTSDPAGSLEIAVAGPVSRYRFGTGTADFLVCARCGVVPAVTWERDGGLFGVVRVQCLAARDALLAHERPADFEAESVELRLARRARNWTPAALAAVPGGG